MSQCSYCGHDDCDGFVRPQVDPYASDVYGETVWMDLCDGAWQERAWDI